jgi:hypothetical protein
MATWKDNEKEFDKLLKRMQTLEKKKVDVGFFDTKYGEENNNLYVAQVAQWQEEGTPNIPPRPFIRTGLHSEVVSPKYKHAFSKAMDNVASGTETSANVCERLGAGLQMELSGVIDNGDKFVANKPDWAAFKQAVTGASSPLVFTGKMRDSVKYKITTRR